MIMEATRAVKRRTMCVILSAIMLFGLVIPFFVVAEEFPGTEVNFEFDTEIMQDKDPDTYYGEKNAAFAKDGNRLVLKWKIDYGTNTTVPTEGYCDNRFFEWAENNSFGQGNLLVLVNGQPLDAASFSECRDDSKEKYYYFGTASEWISELGRSVYYQYLVIKPGISIKNDFFSNNQIVLSPLKTDDKITIGNYDGLITFISAKTIIPAETYYRDDSGGPFSHLVMKIDEERYQIDQRWQNAIREITYCYDNREPAALSFGNYRLQVSLVNRRDYTEGINNFGPITPLGQIAEDDLTQNVGFFITSVTPGFYAMVVRNTVFGDIPHGVSRDYTFTIKAKGYEDTVVTQTVTNPHDWDAGTQIKAATCTEDGEMFYYCTTCGATKREVIPAFHTWNLGEQTVAPTCTAEGEKLFTCTKCGATKTEPVEALGHSWGNAVVTLEPTCTTPGLKTYTCTVCGETKSEKINSTGHKWNNYICSLCGAKYFTHVRVADIPEQEYTGLPIEPAVIVTFDDAVLTEGVDYTLEYNNNIKCGNAQVVVRAMGEYYGASTKSFIIKMSEALIAETEDLRDASIATVAQLDSMVDSEKYTPSSYKRYKKAYNSFKAAMLKENLDQDTVKLIRKKRAAVMKAYLQLVERKDLKSAGAAVDDIASVKYTGKVHTPVPIVKIGEDFLVEGTDYTVSYKNNTNAGTATITITGIGDYKGTITKTFKITKIANTMTAKARKSSFSFSLSKVTKAAQTTSSPATVSKAQGTVTYKKTSGNSNITIDSKTGKLTVKKGTKKDTYTIKVQVKAAGNTNYNSKTTTVTFKVVVK